MKIFVTGTRGIPNIPGGVERHCQELYPLIAAKGHEVVLATRMPYISTRQKKWRGVGLQHIFAPRRKSFEAIIHTFIAVLKARSLKADILHIHGIGPGLMAPVARLLGMKVVCTNHGPDYNRKKWGVAARFMLLLGEFLGGRFANAVIVISQTIRGIVKRRCGRHATIIYNGVFLPDRDLRWDYIEKNGLQPGKYILAVARMVPEKGLHLLIEAFKSLKVKEFKLVIAGDADHPTAYSRHLKDTMADDPSILATGYITGRELNQIYSHAGLFVLPSFVEGLPIALLEAMSYSLPVLVSDIPANKEVDLPNERFFRCGDVDNLKEKLESLLKKGISDEEKISFSCQIAEKYNWMKIADQTIEVYANVLQQNG